MFQVFYKLNSGHTGKIKSRSLLCGAEGFITFIIKTTQKMNHVGYVWTILRKIFPGEISNQVKGMKPFANSEGCVFDLPEETANHFEETLKKDKFYEKNFTVERAETLPETADAKTTYTSSGSNGNFNRNGGPRRGKERKDIFMGNLSFKVETDDIKSFLQKNGIDPEDNIDVRIVTDKDTGKQKGFAFISCYNTDHFNKILRLNGKTYDNRVLRINDANDRPPGK